MACASCSSGKDGSPAGCRSNGSCSSGGCNKLNVYNWLTDMVLPSGQQPYDIVEVRFKGSRKEFFRNKEVPELKVGDVVAVESSPGHDIGIVSMIGELVRFQLRKKGMDENSEGIRALYRVAKPNEIEKWNELREKESIMMLRSRSVIQLLHLNMKLSDVEFQGDGKKATFYYTADERVDFRELIKRLADEFRIRVEMRQIGMRQEASRLGGLGVCGLELCCSTWLTDFKAVTTSAARYQNLALNPAKLAGQCGKLKCCLNYELDSYMDIMRDFPPTNIPLETDKGKAVHQKTDIFKRLMWYSYRGERSADGEGFSGPDGGNWVAMPVDRVKEILALNKSGKKAGDLLEGEWLEVEETEKEPDYLNVVGQDRIDRMDKKKKKKKKKKPSSGGAGGENRTPQEQKPQQQGQRQPQQGQRPQQQQGQRPQQQQGQRPAQGAKPSGDRPQGQKPTENRPPRNQESRPQGPRQPRQQPPKKDEGQ